MEFNIGDHVKLVESPCHCDICKTAETVGMIITALHEKDLVARNLDGDMEISFGNMGRWVLVTTPVLENE